MKRKDFTKLSNRIDELTEKVLNKGTKTSGWWNPDHAARMAVEGQPLLETMSGSAEKNKQFLAAIVSNYALDAALKNFDEYYYDGQPSQGLNADTSFLKDAQEIYTKNILKQPGLAGKIERNEKYGFIFSEASRQATDILRNMQHIISGLGDYAMSSDRDDYKQYSLFGIQSMLRNMKGTLSKKDTRTILDALKYVDNRGQAVALTKCLDKSFKVLEGYYKEMKDRFPLG